MTCQEYSIQEKEAVPLGPASVVVGPFFPATTYPPLRRILKRQTCCIALGAARESIPSVRWLVRFTAL